MCTGFTRQLKISTTDNQKIKAGQLGFISISFKEKATSQTLVSFCALEYTCTNMSFLTPNMQYIFSYIYHLMSYSNKYDKLKLKALHRTWRVNFINWWKIKTFFRKFPHTGSIKNHEYIPYKVKGMLYLFPGPSVQKEPFSYCEEINLFEIKK